MGVGGGGICAPVICLFQCVCLYVCVRAHVSIHECVRACVRVSMWGETAMGRGVN